ncbi:MAG: FliH/SctL family protein [Polyangiaceae bacterium]|jgi:flagellar assembly protein FliH
MAPEADPPRFRHVLRGEIEARARSRRMVEEAHAEAQRIVQQADLDARAVAQRAAEQGREEATARVVAEWIEVRREEQRRLTHDSNRIVAVAVALAERLLQAALDLDPGRIAGIVAGVLAEARGARRAVIDVHPLDAGPLRERLRLLDLDVQPVEVRDDAALSRGELRLHTDLGTIDARIAPRLERLADALRDAL